MNVEGNYRGPQWYPDAVVWLFENFRRSRVFTLGVRILWPLARLGGGRIEPGESDCAKR